MKLFIGVPSFQCDVSLTNDNYSAINIAGTEYSAFITFCFIMFKTTDGMLRNLVKEIFKEFISFQELF